jgi:MSHA biogenesis protein MshP
VSRATCHETRGQRGFSIVTAIFLIVILAALGVFIVSVTGLQQSSSRLDVQGVHAYQAARAGVEWAAYQALDPNNNQPGIGGTDNLPACPAATTTLTGLAGSLSAFSVTVTCSDNVGAGVTEGNRKIATYAIVSTACNQSPCPNPAPATGYVERQLRATLSKCKDPTAASPRFTCG